MNKFYKLTREELLEAKDIFSAAELVVYLYLSSPGFLKPGELKEYRYILKFKCY